MKKKTRNLLIILGAVLVLVVLVIVLNLRLAPSGDQVETTDVRYGSIVSRVTGDGALEAENQVSVSGEIMGRVTRLLVDEGMTVQQGQLLAQLDSTNYKASLDMARARYDQAREAYDRSAKLFELKLISQEEFEGTRANYQSALASYNQAADNFRKTRIVAPISGTVVQRNVNVGEAVIIGTMNNPGTVMMTIADLSRMKALVKVDESDVPAVKVGQEAKVTLDALPDSVFPGTVTKVGYMPITGTVLTQQQGGTDFEVEVTLTRSSPSLRPGMTASADIITARKDSVLVVPVQAVGRRKIEDRETNAVFLDRRGRAVAVPVVPGISSETEIEVVSGLEPGEQVIIGPYRVLARLRDGARVKATSQDHEARRNPGGRPPNIRRPLRVIQHTSGH